MQIKTFANRFANPSYKGTKATRRAARYPAIARAITTRWISFVPS
jgi:hypothetical protein